MTEPEIKKTFMTRFIDRVLSNVPYAESRRNRVVDIHPMEPHDPQEVMTWNAKVEHKRRENLKARVLRQLKAKGVEP